MKFDSVRGSFYALHPPQVFPVCALVFLALLSVPLWAFLNREVILQTSPDGKWEARVSYKMESAPGSPADWRPYLYLKIIKTEPVRTVIADTCVGGSYPSAKLVVWRSDSKQLVVLYEATELRTLLSRVYEVKDTDQVSSVDVLPEFNPVRIDTIPHVASNFDWFKPELSRLRYSPNKEIRSSALDVWQRLSYGHSDNK